jgi:tetratricopeptide (TPR) repeat protein
MKIELVFGWVVFLAGLGPTIQTADEYRDLLQSANDAILKGDYDLAIARCNRAIGLIRDAPAAYITRAWAFTGKGEYDKVIEDCDTALRLSPIARDESTAYTNRATAYSRKRNYEKAINDCRKAIQVDPQNYLPYGNLSWILATCPDDKWRDGKKALELAKKAFEMEPGDANNMDNLAAAYAESGDFDQAVQWQQKAIKGSNKSATGDLYKAMRERLELYKKKMPYRTK